MSCRQMKLNTLKINCIHILLAVLRVLFSVIYKIGQHDAVNLSRFVLNVLAPTFNANTYRAAHNTEWFKINLTLLI